LIMVTHGLPSFMKKIELIGDKLDFILDFKLKLLDQKLQHLTEKPQMMKQTKGSPIIPGTTKATTTTTRTTTTTTTPPPIGTLKMVLRDAQQNDPVQDATARITVGQTVVTEQAVFDSKGTYSQPVTSNGVYTVTISADGFITRTISVDVDCSSPNCVVDKRVILSQELGPGQNRIIMSWEEDLPKDLDMYVVGITKSSARASTPICKVYYDAKDGCPGVSQDRDNAEGGPNGPETVTLLDKTVNSQYTYLIAVTDYNFEDNGDKLLKSGATITMFNDKETKEYKMVATSVTRPDDTYLFGCVEVQDDGGISFTPTEETFFNKEDDSSWIDLNQFC